MQQHGGYSTLREYPSPGYSTSLQQQQQQQQQQQRYSSTETVHQSRNDRNQLNNSNYQTLHHNQSRSSSNNTNNNSNDSNSYKSTLASRFHSRFIRIFFLLAGFDTLFCLLLYIITGKTANPSGNGTLTDLDDYFYDSVIDFEFEASIFDVMLLAPSRFVFLFLFLILINWQHGCFVAISTITSTIYLLVKVFYYDFSDNVPSEYLLFIFAFLMPWMQAWIWAARAWRDRKRKLEDDLNEHARLLNNSMGHSPLTSSSPVPNISTTNRNSFYSTSIYQNPIISTTPAYITKYGNEEVAQVDENRSTTPNFETPFGTPPDKPFGEFLESTSSTTESFYNTSNNNSSNGNNTLKIPINNMETAQYQRNTANNFNNNFNNNNNNNNNNNGTDDTVTSITSTTSTTSSTSLTSNTSAKSFVSNSPNPEKDPELVRIATEALDLMWSMSTSNEGWNLISDKNDLQIYWRQSATVKIFKSVSIVNMSPYDLFCMLFYNIEDQPTWNKNVSDYRILYTIDDKNDVTSTQTTEAAGGMVSPRDFINVRQWRKIGNSYMGAGKSVALDKYPPKSNIIRGWNEAGGWAMLEVPQNPNQCCFVWIINTDLKGWLPKYIIDQTMAGAITSFAASLTEKIEKVKSRK